MKFRICKRVTFDAAHRIPGHPKCGYIHGHTYTVELVLAGKKTNGAGMLVDFGDVSTVLKSFVNENLDHHYLHGPNDHHAGRMTGDGPASPDRQIVAKPTFIPCGATAEGIAAWIYDRLRRSFASRLTLERVRVWETPDSWAEYGP